MDDGAKTIYTAGVSASGTEAGAGVGISGSLAMTAGSFKSKEDMAGLYCATGLSGGDWSFRRRRYDFQYGW